MAHRHHDRMPAIRHTIHGHGPGTVQGIKADDDPANSQESHGKQRKGGQQFAHEIELQGADDSQQPPHPLPVLIPIPLPCLDLTAITTHGLPPVPKKALVH